MKLNKHYKLNMNISIEGMKWLKLVVKAYKNAPKACFPLGRIGLKGYQDSACGIIFLEFLTSVATPIRKMAMVIRTKIRNISFCMAANTM